MNIFVLHHDPLISARMHCDKHVVKMILESAQMLCTVINERGGESPYKSTHKNHPCTIWVGQSIQNFNWLLKLMHGLNEEYKYRYGHERNHLSYDKVMTSLNGKTTIDQFPLDYQTKFAQAMPDQYKQEDSVAAYRAYYLGEKKSFLTYKRRRPPPWAIRVATWLEKDQAPEADWSLGHSLNEIGN